jgi:hypothetical protein
MKEEKKVLLDAEYVRQEIDALMKTPQVQKLIYLQQALQQAMTVPEQIPEPADEKNAAD